MLGPSVTGWIDVPLDSIAAQLILTLGVAIILFYGGLDLSVDVLRRVAVGLGLLVVPGVILTAVIVGFVAKAAFGIPTEIGLLIGAVLAPTDPAILIPLFERLGVRAKISQTVIAESAFNDPIGAVLALTLAGIALNGNEGIAEPVVDFVVELAISTAIGIAVGVVLALVVSSRRAGIWRESAAVAVIAIIAALYYIEDSAGGSGYLGVFLAGLIVGNMDKLHLGMHGPHEHSMRIVVQQTAYVMVILVFVTLGASLPWGDIADEWAPALAVVAALILVARPIVVALCLAPDRRGWVDAAGGHVSRLDARDGRRPGGARGPGRRDGRPVRRAGRRLRRGRDHRDADRAGDDEGVARAAPRPRRLPLDSQRHLAVRAVALYDQGYGEWETG